MQRTPKIAGAAGGVGTTTLATIMGWEDIGRDIADADVIVARNDYRCASALVAGDQRDDAVVVLIVEPQRSLSIDDFRDVIANRVVALAHSIDVARTDDAGLLESFPRSVRSVRATMLDVEASLTSEAV